MLETALAATFTWERAPYVVMIVGLTYVLSLITFRLWLSPISAFPGPRLACLTFWYEFYYQCFRTGSYYLKIKEMHREYGIHQSINQKIKSRT